MRRSSIIGPLLLVLIGGLFLMNNLRPDLPLLEIMGRYWPVLLIAWGALRLLEILYWALRSRPLPTSGVSGGEWTLIILIALVGSGLYLTHRLVARWPQGRLSMRGIEIFGEAYDFPLSAQKAAGKTPRVVIENLRGNARVVGADTEEVRVSGRKTIRAFQQSDANTANQQSPLEILAAGDRITIRTNQERASGDQRISADLEITVPRGSTVEGRGRYGDFDISEIGGGVEVDSDNAGVRLNNIGGQARLDLRRSDIVRAIGVKGGVDVKGGRGQEVELENIEGPVTVNGSFSGDLQFRNLARSLRFESSQTTLAVEKVPGQIRIALGQISAENVAGPMRLNTRSRDVVLGDITQSVEITLDRGDVHIHPTKIPLAKMDIETRSGNILMAMPEGARFDLTAVTKRGEIENEYGDPLRVVAESGRDRVHSATLAGVVGQGPQVKLTTARGSITVRKAGAAESGGRRTSITPPAPPKPPEPVRLPVDRQ